MTLAPPESRDPATVVTQAVVTVATIGCAGGMLAVLAARMFALSFSFVVATGPIIWAAAGLIAVARLRRARMVWSRRAGWHLGLLLALAAASGALACAINAPEEDDSTYVPPAIQALAHPERAMSADFEWVVPFSSGRLHSNFGMVSNNLETLWAAASRVSGFEFLHLYQIGGAILFGAAFPLVYFQLLSRFSRSTPAALVGTLAVVISAFLLFREGGAGLGMVINKIWIGKAGLALIMIPLVADFAFAFADSPSPARWLLLGASVIAATGFSASGLFLLPVLLASLTPGSVIQSLATRTGPRRTFWAALGIPAAALYPVGLAVVLLFKYRDMILRHPMGAVAAPSSSVEIFTYGFTLYFGSLWSITSVLVIVSVGWLLYARTSVYRPLMWWLATGIVLFVNPITAGVVARNLTSVLVYNRIFYTLPLFAVVGVAVADLAGRCSTGLRTALLAASIAEAAALYGFHLSSQTLPIDTPKATVLGSPHFGAPFVRMDPGLISDVRELEALLPEGNTLAASDYALAMSMLTARFPQYVLWPIDVIDFYGELQGSREEAAWRSGAARFLVGRTDFRGDFERLLDTPVRNVVLSNRLGYELSDQKRIVAAKGFVLVRETARYVAYVRRP